jgi:succinate dehydrogenase flavin-adding protein (antitoxin of CptAB toxin-antitoxin module)
MAEMDACVARFMKVIIRNLATQPDAEILGMAELDACVARFMKVIIRNLATQPDAENRLKKTKTKFCI